MANCPCCNGVGTTPMKVTTIADGGRSESSVNIPCWYCNGRKQVSVIDALYYPIMLKQEADMWCKCKQDYGTYYVPDRGGVKHHWNCKKCRKLVQVG